MFKRRKKPPRIPDSVEIELKMEDGIGRVVSFTGCWDWEDNVKKGLVLTTGRTGHDLSGGSASVAIRPPDRESYNKRHRMA
jgi:hypothetical protein